MAEEQSGPSWTKVILALLEGLGAKEFLLNLAAKKTYIIVVGSTGAGKTALGRALTSLEQQVIAVADRTEVISKHKEKIAQNLIIRFDTPGEIAKVASEIAKLTDALTKPRVGVIQVVSNGYHEPSRRMAGSLKDDPAALDKYLADKRQLEIDYLREFGARYPFNHSVDWSITACTKADLWWSDVDAVLDRYKGEEFQKVSRDICLKPSTVRPFSSAMEPFLGVVPVDAAFGEDIRRTIRSEFISALIQHMRQHD